MATQTTNIGLTKPNGTENVSRQVINDNYDAIDTAINNRKIIQEKSFTVEAPSVTGSSFDDVPPGTRFGHRNISYDAIVDNSERYRIIGVYWADDVYPSYQTYDIPYEINIRLSNGRVCLDYIKAKERDTGYAIPSNNNFIVIYEDKRAIIT